jgi:hypothetical protein
MSGVEGVLVSLSELYVEQVLDEERPEDRAAAVLCLASSSFLALGMVASGQAASPRVSVFSLLNGFALLIMLHLRVALFAASKDLADISESKTIECRLEIASSLV